MAEIQLEQLTKVYPDGTKAVSGLDLEVGNGEFVVFVGPSGCGKTSALRMIAGLEPITEGTVRIGGDIVNTLPPKDRDVAMVFQNYALYPHMSAYDNMAFALKMRGVPKPEIERRVLGAARALGLAEVLKKKPRTLSGGQRQRVAMGRAMVREPSVFLFDEPLSNLDAALRAQMRIEIGSLQRRLKTTTVYVTHDQVEAMTLGDRIVVLADGRIQQIGRPIELYESPVNRFVAGFIGTPSMNFLDGVLHDEGGRTYFATDGARVILRRGAGGDASGLPVTMGIRPEDLAMETNADQDALRGKVVLVERLGGTSHIHFEVGQHRLLASVANQALPEVGDNIAVHVPEARAHLFSADGVALTRAERA
jgi:multiple sugar transport system ATP-binding protein